MSLVFGSGVFGSGSFGGGPSLPGPVPAPVRIGSLGYAATLAFDPGTNDLAIPIQIAKGDAAIEQKVRSVLRFFLGEWFLDTRLGVPYIQKVFIKDPQIPAINALFRRVLLTVKQIVSVQTLSTTVDRQTREGFIDFVAVIDDGRTLTAVNEPFIIQ